MENSDYFRTPENLFFSRRMTDPQFGARLTGKIGRWGIGALVGDDRAPGERAPEDADYYGDRAAIGIFRLYRELGNESRIGGLITSRDFAGSSNRVFSLDTRLRLTRNLLLTGQLIESRNRDLDGDSRSGTAGFLRLAQSGRHFSANAYYRDRSPDFEANALGFINRVNIRETGGSTGYTWRPVKRRIVSFGPSFSGSFIYDHDGTLTDWTVSPSFRMELPRNSYMSFTHHEYFERFAGIDFRRKSNAASISSQWQKWLHLSTSLEHGDGINYYSPTGPFMGKSLSTNSSLKIMPTPQLQIDETYLYSRLAAADGRGTVFNNHIWRTKANYQFTRELSLRAIVDYNAVLPNDALVRLERRKRLGLDFLFTYMLHPGTALYIGYTDNYENLRFNPSVSPLERERAGFPDTSVGRQIFAKFSYLLRI